MHCVIIGFSIKCLIANQKKIFIDERYQIAKTSMLYLLDAVECMLRKQETSLSAIFQKLELEINQLMVDIIF